jgi:amino acid adenylation domain-containing protein
MANGSDRDASPIARGASASEAPASFGQERLWFLHHFEGADVAYNRPANRRFHGALDIDALRQSFDEIIRRHEALRTTFSSTDGRPMQRIRAEWRMPVSITDIGHLPPAEREAEARRLAVEEAQRPFDLARGPLMRGRLLRLDRDDHILLLTLHHIVFDGWSEGILFSEFAALYRAFSNGLSSPLTPLPIQYADFALWQRQRLQGEFLDELISYWKKRLERGSHVLDLPTDRPRPAFQTFAGTCHSFRIPQKLRDALRRHGQAQGATLFMTLLAAFQCFLRRYTHQENVLVGCPVSTRNRLETENLIGFFVNMLILGADFSARSTFRDVLRSARDSVISALAHQDLPFEKLVDELAVDRDTSRTPLFQALFQLRNYPRPAIGLPELEVSPFVIDGGFEKYDLNVELVADNARGLECRFRYNTDLFDAGTIARMGNHFHTLLEGIAAGPDRRVTRLPLLTQAERHQLLVDWNATRSEYPRDECLHELFEEQAQRTPAAVAVRGLDQQLTYRQLDTRANQLAHYLRKRGVGPEVLVGLCMERSMDLVVGLLAILKAGGAYVPLDPSYPKERLAFMLADARVPVLLTRRNLLEILPEHAGRVVCLDTDWDDIALESEEKVPFGPGPGNLAYLLYTSGSTGNPKAVAIEHRSPRALLSWAHSVFSAAEMAGVLASTSICFDLSVFELFAPLTMGGRVILAENALALPELAAISDITLINTVPSAIAELLLLNAVPPSTRTICLAGEPLKPDLVREIYQSTRVTRVYDLYGPTEDTTYSTFALRTPDGPQTIGRPIAGTQAYVLDTEQEPAPIGVSGELHLGGKGLARGYFKRPESTAEKFVPDPFSREPGRRLYKTGDMARYLADGNIEFLGRVDHQVKIRGFRIELGEIESVLAQHSEVREAIVVAQEDAGPSTQLKASKRLAAYIVPRRSADAWASEISEAEAQNNQISGWETVFDETFAAAGEPGDPLTNTAGVNSSYTNEPIPAAESRDWVEHAAARILSLNPNRVLDIGCGLGRMLFRIAPYCSRYWGTDFSQPALDYVSRHLDLLGDKPGEIKLIRARAGDFGEIPKSYFDAIVINGVVQYFPHIDHLVKVLEGALEAVEPGGVIFIGDVRSLPLLEAFRLSVELYQAPDDTPTDTLWQRVGPNVAQENELVVDPAFFTALPRRLAKVNRAVVLLKRGRAQNELTRFRYDVILYTEPQAQPAPPVQWHDWSKETLSLATVRERLSAGKPHALGILRVPNARVLPEVEAATSLACGDAPGKARELRDAMEARREGAVHPEDFWVLQEELPYRVDLTWSATGGPEYFDVFLQRRDSSARRPAPPSFPEAPTARKSSRFYAHNPIEARPTRGLQSSLRSFVEKKLPAYMIPSAFVILDTLPLMPNGKVDRKALPLPDQSRPQVESFLVAPRTPVEQSLAEIWAEVLSLAKLGAHDNFFDLGGHSLLATQVISRIRQILQVELPLRALFETPTIAGLAERIETILWARRKSQPSYNLTAGEREEIEF